MAPAAARDLQQPSWRPDPTGRHDYRWWTGVDWSDQVGDRGSVSIDPGAVPVATARPPSAAAYRRRRSLAIGVVAVLVAGAVGGVVWSRRSDPVFGVETLTLDPTTGTAERSVSLRAGEVVRIRIEPSTRIDTTVHVMVSEAVARRQAAAEVGEGQDADAHADRVYRSANEVFERPAAVEAYRLAVVVDSIDSGSIGRPDAGWFAALADGEYRFVVAVEVGRAAGTLRSIVERHDETYGAGESDLEASLDAPFFREPAFYVDATPYAPAG